MKALIKENKYINISPFSSGNELFKNFSWFYLLPTFIVEYVLYYGILYNAGTRSFFNYANSILNFESLLIVGISLFFFSVFMLGKFILAFLNVICIIQNDFQYPLSTGKKVGIFFIMLVFPGATVGIFLTFIFLKNGYQFKGIPLFITLSILCAILSFSFNKLVINPTFEKRANSIAANLNKPKGEPVDPGLKQKVESYKTKYRDKIFETKVPLFYQSGLPKSFRFNYGHLIKEDRELVEFRHSCSNCLDHKRIENPIRLEFVPSGTKLKVVDSFKTVAASFGLGGDSISYIVIEDEQKKRAEISELGFELNVLKAGVQNFDDTPALLPLIDEYNHLKELQLVVCDRESIGDRSIYKDPIDKSKNVNLKLHRFIHDFQLQNDLEIKKTATMFQPQNRQDTTGCSLVEFKTLQPLFLLYYYGEDWDIEKPSMHLEEFFHFQNSPFKDFDYKKFISLSEKEALEF